MPVTVGLPDPYPPLQDAVDEVVFAEGRVDEWTASWRRRIAVLARTTFDAVMALRRDVRELYARTARQNDDVTALAEAAKAQARLTRDLTERVGQAEEVIADTARGAADGEASLLRQIADTRTAAKTWIVATGRRVDHLRERVDFNGRMVAQLLEQQFVEKWRVDELEQKHDRLQLLVDELAGITDPPQEIEEEQEGQADELAPGRVVTSDTADAVQQYLHPDTVVVPRRLINFITDGRWDVEEAVNHLQQWELDNSRWEVR